MSAKRGQPKPFIKTAGYKRPEADAHERIEPATALRNPPSRGA